MLLADLARPVALASPYARFNVFRNPFGELTRDERSELAVVDGRRWRDALASPSTAVQFIGPSGHGKTTHLLALRRHLPDAGYVYLPEDGPRPSIPGTRPLLLDEAQRLSWRQRRQVFREGGPLALGTHDDLAEELERAGLRVVTCCVSQVGEPEQLLAALNRRIEASRLSAGPVPRVGRPQAVALLRRHGGNIRAIEQELYDDFQHAVREGMPWPPAT